MTGFDTEEELLLAYQLDSGSVEADDNIIDVLLASSPVLAGVLFEGDIKNGTIPQNLKVCSLKAMQDFMKYANRQTFHKSHIK